MSRGMYTCERRGTRYRDLHLWQLGSAVTLFIRTTTLKQNIKITYYILHITQHNLIGMRPQSTEENIGFDEPDHENVQVGNSTLDPMAQLPLANDAPLGDFLSRPVKIHSSSWSPSTDLNFTIYPWLLFFSNERVQNRLNNFKLLRCNLCVKVVINGNSFYYGRLLVNYNPMADRDDYLELPTGEFRQLIRLSQRQHIYCDPCTSTAGCLKLPFLFDTEFFDVPDILTDAKAIGSLSVSTPVGLRLVSDASSTASVNVSFFAWATDVTVGGLTNSNIDGLVPQASKIPDETGMKLSSLAKTVSTFAGRFGSFPTIGLYAKATEIAAAAVGDLAQMFGFSRPALVEEPMRYQPRPISSLSTCIGQDNSLKLTTDPKQEVSVDPTIWSGNSQDELAIADLASTWSLLDRFNWTGADPAGEMLFNALVDPGIYHRSPSATQDIYPTPMCALSLPFKYWSGSLEFKFDIVASAFHRGRLAIVYDPHDTPVSFETNTNYMEIIDISDNRRTEFSISNSQHTSLRKHFVPGVSDTPFAGVDSGYSSTNKITISMIYGAGDIGNGTISVFIVNELTSPSLTTPSITVLVSVRAGEDFRVYDPNDSMFHYSFMTPQSSKIEPIPLDIEETQRYSFGVRGNGDYYPNVYIGERILSIRSLLKRYVAYLTMKNDIIGHETTNLTRFRHAMYPLMHYYADDTVHTAVGPNGINFVGHTYLSYFRTAFAVLRGGVRWKVTPLIPPPTPGVAQMSVTRYENVTFSELYDVPIGNGLYVFPRSCVAVFDGSTCGEALTTTDVNGCLEFEVPYHSNRKFIVASSSEETEYTNELGGFQVTGSDHSFGEYVQIYCAAAEDATLGHFIGFPMMRYYQYVPTAFVPS